MSVCRLPVLIYGRQKDVSENQLPFMHPPLADERASREKMRVPLRAKDFECTVELLSG